LTDTTTSFNEIEQQAADLVEKLTALRRETESYVGARAALDTAVAGISGVMKQLSAAASGLTTVSVTLREIGTPQILQTQDELRVHLEQSVSEFRSQVNVLQGGLVTRLDQTEEAVRTEVRSRILELEDGLSTKIEATDAAVRAVHPDVRIVGQRTEVLQDSAAKLAARLGTVEGDLKTLRAMLEETRQTQATLTAVQEVTKASVTSLRMVSLVTLVSVIVVIVLQFVRVG